MTETPSDMRPGTWQVPECPLLIEYSPAILDEIRLAVVDAFFSLPRGGAEIGGVLFGSHDGVAVRITAFRPMECEHAMGPTFVLSDKDRARLGAQLEQSRQAPESGLEVVGWYHSHTRSEIFLSPLDLEIYNQFFPEPWQVALVMRPAGMKPTRAGFFFRDRHGAIQSAASYHEFIVGEAGAYGGGNGRPAAGAPANETARKPLPDTPPDPADELPSPLPAPASIQRLEAVPARRAVDAGPAIDIRPAEFVPPAFMIAPERERSRVWLWLALVMLAGAGAAAYLTSGQWMRALSLQPAHLHLQALDHDGQLRIQWDGASLSSANVRGGALAIVDGAWGATIPLDAARLRAGSFQYARRTEIVEAHLTVRTGHGNPLEEFTTFYGPPPKPASSAGPEKKPATDLAAEAERERGELQRSLEETRQIMRRREERKRVENQMPAAATQTAETKPPAKPAGGLAQTGNKAPPDKPREAAQSVVLQAINAPAPAPDKLPMTAEKPAAQPSRDSLTGRWVYSPASKSRSAFQPESVTIMLSEADGQVRGRVTGRYKAPRNHKLSGRVNFTFGGPAPTGSSKFSFRGADGLKGEIELIRLPGKQDAIEVVWYSERDKLTFDDIFFRMP